MILTINTFFYKNIIADVFVFLTIILLSTVLYCITLILKIKFLILKLKTQVLEINNLIALLDKNALVLEKNIKLGILMEQDDNRIIAGLIFIAIGVTIAILLFFFSGGGGSGPSSDTSSSVGDSFSSKSSESSFSKSSSSTDLGVKDTYSANWDNLLVPPISEGSVVQTQMLEQLNTSLMEIMEKAASKLLPTLSNWIEFSNKKILFFDESPTVRVGSSLKDWLLTLDNCTEKIKNGDLSIDVLQSVDSTMNSITDNLPDFLKQLDRFMAKANLNVKTLSETTIKDYEFILDSREVAKELLQKILENENLLTQISPGSIVLPEWFPGLICFFSMLNVISSEQLTDLLVRVRSVYVTIHDYFNSENPDCLTFKDNLLKKLYYYHTKMREFMDNSTDRISTLRFISIARSPEDFQRIPDLLTKLLEYHECLNIDTTNIFLFLG